MNNELQNITFYIPNVKAHITDREVEILKLISFELTSKEIASSLFISIHTVETHKKNLKFKLKVKNTAGLIRKGFELSILNIAQTHLTLSA